MIQSLKAIFGIGLVYVLIQKGMFDVDKLRVLAQWNVFLVGFLLVAFNVVFLAWRWRFLLKFYEFTISFFDTLKLYLIGTFFNYALPGSVSGDLVKAYYLSKGQTSRLKSALSVLVDRILGLYSMLLISFFSSVFVFHNSDPNSPVAKLIESSWIALALATLGLGALFVVPLSKAPVIRKFPKVSSLFESLYDLGRTPYVILSSLFASVFAQMSTMYFFYWMAPYFGVTVSFWTCLFCVPLGFIVMAIPISPAGLGVGQLAFYSLFESLEKGSGDVGSLAITAFQAFQILWALPGAYFYMRFKHKPKDQ